jgi:hypothetical protein
MELLAFSLNRDHWHMKNRVIARDPVIHGRPGQVGKPKKKRIC